MVFFGTLYILIKCSSVENERRARCTERVLAEVIYFTNVEHYNREKGTVYSEKAPVYEYSYKGVFCRCTGGFSSAWRKKNPVGSQAELFVDPEDPKSFICPEEERNSSIQAIKWICIIARAVLLVILGICLTVAYLNA